jgi:hypothetical protein
MFTVPHNISILVRIHVVPGWASLYSLWKLQQALTVRLAQKTAWMIVGTDLENRELKTIIEIPEKLSLLPDTSYC